MIDGEKLFGIPEIEFCVEYNEKNLLVGVNNCENLLRNIKSSNTKNEKYNIQIFNTKYLEKELLINKSGYLPSILAKNITEIKVNDFHKKLINYNRRCTLVTALLLEEDLVPKTQLLETIIEISSNRMFSLGKKNKANNSFSIKDYEELLEIYTNDELYTTNELGLIEKKSDLCSNIDSLQQDMLDYLNKHEYKNRNYENRKEIIKKYLLKKKSFINSLNYMESVNNIDQNSFKKKY